MHPYKFLALGLVIVIVNLTISDFDLLVDAIGWTLVVFALDRLARQGHAVFRNAVPAAVVAGVGSLPTLLGISVPALLGTLFSLFGMAAFFLIASAAMTVARDQEDSNTAGRFNTAPVWSNSWATLTVSGAWLQAAGMTTPRSLNNPTK